MAKLEVKVFEKPLFPDKSIDKGVQSCVQPHEEPENPKCNYTFLKIGIGDHSVETSEKNKHLIIREVGGSSGNSVPVDISCIDPVGPCDEIHKTKALDFLDRSGNNAKLKNSDDSSASFNAHAYDIKDLELSEQLKFEKLKDRVCLLF